MLIYIFQVFCVWKDMHLKQDHTFIKDYYFSLKRCISQVALCVLIAKSPFLFLLFLYTVLNRVSVVL